jgi:hypothetical protein
MEVHSQRQMHKEQVVLRTGMMWLLLQRQRRQLQHMASQAVAQTSCHLLSGTG